MSIEYKIRKFDESTGQIIVQYKDLAPISIDLPIDEQGNIPINENLDKHIQSYLPVWHFARIEKLKLGLKSEQINYIKSLVEALPEPTVIEEIVENNVDKREQDKAIIVEVLEELGLYPPK